MGHEIIQKAFGRFLHVCCKHQYILRLGMRRRKSSASSFDVQHRFQPLLGYSTNYKMHNCSAFPMAVSDVTFDSFMVCLGCSSHLTNPLQAIGLLNLLCLGSQALLAIAAACNDVLVSKEEG